MRGSRTIGGTLVPLLRLARELDTALTRAEALRPGTSTTRFPQIAARVLHAASFRPGELARLQTPIAQGRAVASDPAPRRRFLVRALQGRFGEESPVPSANWRGALRVVIGSSLQWRPRARPPARPRGAGGGLHLELLRSATRHTRAIDRHRAPALLHLNDTIIVMIRQEEDALAAARSAPAPLPEAVRALHGRLLAAYGSITHAEADGARLLLALLHAECPRSVIVRMTRRYSAAEPHAQIADWVVQLAQAGLLSRALKKKAAPELTGQLVAVWLTRSRAEAFTFARGHPLYGPTRFKALVAERLLRRLLE